MNKDFGRRCILLFYFFHGLLFPLVSQDSIDRRELIVENLGSPVNSALQEFGPSLSPDAKTLYFYSKSNRNNYTDIFITRKREDGTWESPNSLSKINSPYDDQSPFVTRDGKLLLFSSNRDGSVEVRLPNGKLGVSRDLYVTEWDGASWTEPYPLPPTINTDQIEENPHLLGDTLLFTRYPFGKPELAKVYYSQLKSNEWTKPKLLPSPINDTNATIAAAWNDDGSILFFASNRPGGYGGFDLYMIRKDGDSFKDLENLGPPINSELDEAYIVFQQVKKTFLFCRRLETSSFDIFQAYLKNPDNAIQTKLKESNRLSLESVHFERASAELKPESTNVLDNIVDFLHENPKKRMKIIGHTDLTGNFEDNMILSKERALSVKRYFVRKGINDSRIETDGKGPTSPVVNSADEESSKRNRRTEFVLIE